MGRGERPFPSRAAGCYVGGGQASPQRVQSHVPLSAVHVSASLHSGQLGGVDHPGGAIQAGNDVTIGVARVDSIAPGGITVVGIIGGCCIIAGAEASHAACEAAACRCCTWVIARTSASCKSASVAGVAASCDHEKPLPRPSPRRTRRISTWCEPAAARSDACAREPHVGHLTRS